MKFNFSVLITNDLEATVTFYKKVFDFRLVKRLETKIGQLVYLCSEKVLDPDLVIFQYKEEKEITNNGIIFCFTTDENLTSCKEKIEKLGYKTSEIMERNFSICDPYFELRDPNGILIQISN